MRKPVGAAALTLMAAALTIGLSATSSLATAVTTWTVSPGGTISGAGLKTVLKDTTSGTTVTCTSSAATGTLKSGTKLKGAGIGTITSVAFNNCTVLGQTVSLSTGTVAWPINAKTFTSGVTHGTISGIHFAISSSICNAVIDGTSGTANDGTVKITYTNSTHKLKILATGGTLHVYNVNGCLGLINNNDAGSITSTYTVTPAQTITAP